MKKKDKHRGKRVYENGNGRRRKNGKKESTRNMTLEEKKREFQEDGRIKRKKKNVR